MDVVVDEFLAHYGVKGMKWGVRRAARKDANEFAAAKMYYGKGAGKKAYSAVKIELRAQEIKRNFKKFGL